MTLMKWRRGRVSELNSTHTMHEHRSQGFVNHYWGSFCVTDTQSLVLREEDIVFFDLLFHFKEDTLIASEALRLLDHSC